MLYLAHFSCDGEHNGEAQHGWFTCVVEADDVEASVDKLRHLVMKLYRDENVFNSVMTVYLEDIIQVRQVPEEGFLAHYSSSPGEAPPSTATTLWGDTDAYCFYGQTGQGVVIEMSRTSGALEPRVQLYDPYGVRVSISEVREYETPRARIEDYQLNMSGIYTIVASDGSWNVDTGEYGLSLVLTGSSTTSPQDCDGEDVTTSPSMASTIFSVSVVPAFFNI